MIQATGSCLGIAYQSGILEYPQVLGDGGPADGEGASQFVYREGPGSQSLKDGEPGGIAQSFEPGL